MARNSIKQNLQRTFFADLIICCIVPNILGCLYSLYLLYKKRTTYYAYLFLSLFVLFLTYNFYSVDNTLRFLRALSGLSSEDWISGNPLDYILMFFQTIVGLQSSLVFFLYIYMVYFFWYNVLRYNVTVHNESIFIVMLLCSLALRDVIDLLYYSLSILFAVFFVSKHNSILKLKNWIILFLGVYIFHPGLFLLLVPAVILFLIGQYTNKFFYYISIVFLYFIGIVLAHSHGLTTGISIIDVQLEAFDSYTSDSRFGIRKEALSGITYTIQFYVLPFIYAVVCFIASKNCIFLNRIEFFKRKERCQLKFQQCSCDKLHRGLNNKRVPLNLLLSLFQVCVVFYPSFISFVTISERILVTMSICAFLYMYKLVSIRKISSKIVSSFTILFFLFTTIRCSSPIELKYIFRYGSYNEIPMRCYYMPSIMLFDYNNWGFSDDFVRKNSYVYDRFS